MKTIFFSKEFGMLAAMLLALLHVTPLLPSKPNYFTDCFYPEQTECSICLSDLNKGTVLDLNFLSCGHEYHSECITAWLRKKQHCPFCRRVVNSVYTYTPNILLVMASLQDIYGLEFLLTQVDVSSFINAIDPQHNNILHHIARLEHTQSAALFQAALQQGANPNQVNSDKQSPLHIAALNGQRKITILLLNTPAFTLINSPDKRGNTALHYALATRNVYTATELLEHDAQTDLVNKRGYSALDIAQVDSTTQHLLEHAITLHPTEIGWGKRLFKGSIIALNRLCCIDMASYLL